MHWPINEYSINDIFLDPENIRQQITDTAQDAILQDLFSNEDAFELVKSFSKHGLFPDEFPIVIRENNKLIVIEGNRRLAALKALDNPDRVPLFKAKIKTVINPKIQKIRAVIAPNRETALVHIANKHTINLRKNWAPLRQAYFYKSQLDNGKTVEQLRELYPEHDITLFIRRLAMHHIAKSIVYDDDAVTLKVHDERTFPITNLERMYDDAYIQKSLGITFNNGLVEIYSNKEDFLRAYKKIVTDVAIGEIDSRKYNKDTQRKEYIDQLIKEIKPEPIHIPEPNKKEEKKVLTIKAFKEQKINKSELKQKVKSAKKQKGLIPSYVPFRLENSSLQELYDELKRIEVKAFPNATHDLLRSFLECTLVHYLKEVTNEYSKVKVKGGSEPTLDNMLYFISEDTNCTSITDKAMKKTIVQMRTNYTKPYSLARMNMTNHDENWATTEKDARVTWGNMEKLMKHLLNPNKE